MVRKRSVRYERCGACGKKGVYREKPSPFSTFVGHVARCRYCGVQKPVPYAEWRGLEAEAADLKPLTGGQS